MRMSMKLAAGVMALVILLAGCGAQTSVRAEAQDQVCYPAQENLPRHTEYLFAGKYDTGAIGVADVQGNFSFDGTYDVSMSMWGYEAHVTWGTWDYTDGQFVLTDTDNDVNFVTTREGDTYSFTALFNDAPIVMSATMSGTKDAASFHVDPDEGREAPAVPAPAPASNGGEHRLQLSLPADGGFSARFYSDGVFTIYNETAMMDMTTGSWTYTDGKLVIFVGEDVIEAVEKDGQFTFTATAMVFTREYTVSKADFESAIAGEGTAETEPVTVMDDRYSSVSDDEWAGYWQLEDGNGTYQAKGFPVCALDEQIEDILPKSYFAPVEADKRGRVEKFEYETYAYTLYEEKGVAESEWTPIRKDCYVYLPNGYDPDQQYNFFYLLPGAMGSNKDWFNLTVDGRKCGDLQGDLVRMADYLIAEGMMEPVIFVSCTTDLDVSALPTKLKNAYSGGTGVTNFLQEFGRDLVPAVETAYGSYAGDASRDSLASSRRHRAVGGLSMGAYVTWNTMANNIDIAAYYAPIANGCSLGEDQTEGVKAMYQSMMDKMDGNIDMGFLFASCGVKDHTWDEHMRTVDALADIGGDQLVYGTNFYSHNPTLGTHTSPYFILGVYNAMKVFFK